MGKDGEIMFPTFPQRLKAIDAILKAPRARKRL